MHSFFPQSYMLSQAVMRTLYTGGSPGEVLSAVDELLPLPEEEQVLAWPQAWVRIAEFCGKSADGDRVAGHVHTARESYLRSAIYFQWASTYGCTHEELLDLQRQSRVQFRHFAELATPVIESVRVPYGKTYLPAWFVPAAGGSERDPVAVYLPGWDSTKEQGYILASELATRGIATLLLDGPGIGEALYELGLVNRSDYEVPGSAAVDYVLSRDDVEPDGVFVVGSSLGGYRAGRVCSFERRLAGSDIWGALWDFEKIWALWSERGVNPTKEDHAVRALGLSSVEEIPAALSTWKLEGVADQITCPLLILHGALDAQVPTTEAEALYEAASSADKTLRVFEADEFGSAHCQNDHRMVAHTAIGDWLMDRWRARAKPIPRATGEHKL